MTTSKIAHLPPLARSVNAQTKPVRGLRDCKQRLALELRVRRDGEPIQGAYAALWRIRGKMDVSNAVKVVEDAAQGVLVGNDRDCEALHVQRAHDAGPDIEVSVFAWPTERRVYLAAIEAATMDWDAESRAMHDQRGAHR